MNVRDLVNGLVPPLLRSAALRILRPPITFSGPYADWGAACAMARGYAEPSILGRVEAATRHVLQSGTGYEQDGVAFAGLAPVTPALEGLLLAAAVERGDLRVVDFGGSLGTHFLKWRRFFERLPSVTWHVVEQAAFADAGASLFRGKGIPIFFHSNIEAAELARPSALLLGSVLQYLEHPLETLAKLRGLDPKIIVIDRTPFSDDDRDHICVQNVPPRIYPGSYPLHLLAFGEVRQLLESEYEHVDSFQDEAAPALTGGVRANFRGSVWIKRGLDVA